MPARSSTSLFSLKGGTIRLMAEHKAEGNRDKKHQKKNSVLLSKSSHMCKLSFGCDRKRRKKK